VKYIGLDVHRDAISVAVADQGGRLVMQSVTPTQAPAILDCVGGIQGTLHVTLEEGTHSAWLYDLLQRVKKLPVFRFHRSRHAFLETRPGVSIRAANSFFSGRRAT
jgi:hypothetical protein